MKKLTNTLGVLALALAAGVGCADKEDERDDTDPIERRADDPAREAAAADRAADNTGVNERDRADGVKTAGSADLDQSDVDLMAKIRKRVVDHDDLGTNAKNVKIIAEDGKVTLRGPVANAEEKAAIEAIARDVAGGNVTSELEIAP